MKRVLEILITAVLISCAGIGTAVAVDGVRDWHRINQQTKVELDSLLRELDSLSVRYVRDSTQAAEFIKRVDSLIFVNDTTILLKR